MVATQAFLSSGKRVAIYARVSTIEQAEEGYSIDEQLRLLRERCKSQGWEVYQEYADRGISGKSIDARPQLKKLLDDAGKKVFDMVLVWKTNRLARNIKDLLNMVDLLDKRNIAFRSYSENIETETPAGKLQLHMLAAIAEFERGTIAQNVKMGMLARAEEGNWNGGKILGYNSVEIPSNKKKKCTQLVVNDKEAQTVRRIFDLYVHGNGYKSIANKINKEGHRSKKGNPFSISAIKTILTNPVYVGMIRYNVRRDWSEKRRNNINPEPIIQQGKHQAIISQEVWDKAQTILKGRSYTPNRVHSGEHPLTGIMKCPQCGAGMVLGRTTNRNKDGSKRILEYYVCGSWKNKGTSACNSNGIRIDYADAYVLNKLNLVANSDKLLHDVLDKVNKRDQQQTQPLKKEYEELKRAISALQVKKDKIMELYVDGVVGKDDLKERLEKLNEEKELLEHRLMPLTEVVESRNIQNVSFELVKEVLTNFSENLKKATTSEQTKQLLHLLIQRITINEDRKIDTIRIQLNKEVAQYLLKQGEEESLFIDDFSSPFCVYIDI
ncbi:recombinase family protein [Ammoniphilus resinae]|uniref:Site-specific DNA recombinase n=1 Tax=Ammoniphilus resinae TaxID=861532 RepID=A0ABS4GVX1_9BACL|nr:recombinase family protein [Ammoniphilus resinae]MBP1934406.1 site-specific DNA recombinase [Ammoniphilus resinae]